MMTTETQYSLSTPPTVLNPLDKLGHTYIPIEKLGDNDHLLGWLKLSAKHDSRTDFAHPDIIQLFSDTCDVPLPKIQDWNTAVSLAAIGFIESSVLLNTPERYIPYIYQVRRLLKKDIALRENGTLPFMNPRIDLLSEFFRAAAQAVVLSHEYKLSINDLGPADLLATQILQDLGFISVSRYGSLSLNMGISDSISRGLFETLDRSDNTTISARNLTKHAYDWGKRGLSELVKFKHQYGEVPWYLEAYLLRHPITFLWSGTDVWQHLSKELEGLDEGDYKLHEIKFVLSMHEEEQAKKMEAEARIIKSDFLKSRSYDSQEPPGYGSLLPWEQAKLIEMIKENGLDPRLAGINILPRRPNPGIEVQPMAKISLGFALKVNELVEKEIITVATGVRLMMDEQHPLFDRILGSLISEDPNGLIQYHLTNLRCINLDMIDELRIKEAPSYFGLEDIDELWRAIRLKSTINQ